MLPLNPGAKFHDGKHNGYVRCELTPETLRADIVTIADRADPRSSQASPPPSRSVRRPTRPPY